MTGNEVCGATACAANNPADIYARLENENMIKVIDTPEAMQKAVPAGEVPEPVAQLLTGLGLVAVAALMRKRLRQ